MGKIITESLVETYFVQYAFNATRDRLTGDWQAGCPICREGKSLGSKRRLYYIKKRNQIFCHNCGWSSTPLKWMMEVSGHSMREIINEDEDTYDLSEVVASRFKQSRPAVPTLPGECANLYDLKQRVNLRGNQKVAQAIQYCEKRRLYSAINRPTTLWCCYEGDFIHEGRIILPFHDSNNQIIFYQSRAIIPDPNLPNYLGKKGGVKSIFNFDKIDSTLDHVFIFEGPIDACFVENGIAVAGITQRGGANFTEVQQRQMDSLLLVKRIWVLDNQWIDETARSKSNHLIDQGELVFIWPKELRKFKDINQYCVEKKVDSVESTLFTTNVYANKLKAKLMLQLCK